MTENANGQRSGHIKPGTGQIWSGQAVTPDEADSSLDAPENQIDLFGERRANLRRHLERAQQWQSDIEGGVAENAADIATRAGLTRARVSQVMKLLQLAPEILEEIRDTERSGPIPTERQLRKIANIGLPEAQKRDFHRQVRLAELAAGSPEAINASRGPKNRGFQHLFARAGALKKLFDSGEYSSLKELGHSVGLSAERIGQLLNYAQLAPDLQAKLDVPGRELPKGFKGYHLRRITVLREHEEQRQLFAEILSEIKQMQC